ncbi:MAG: hypothetical protein FWF75_03530 [Propionibacteriaceae bacterium]|nr:hypothetical protein [Propionibacteriaceae bacterium]
MELTMSSYSQLIDCEELTDDDLTTISGGTNWFYFWQDTALAIAGVASAVAVVAAPEISVPALIAAGLEYGSGTAGMLYEYF